MKTRLAVLAVAALVFLSDAAGGAVLNPTADSYVRDGSSASTNFGTVTPLEVRTSSSGQNRDAFFKFDVAGITGITLVKLRVNANLSGSGNVATSTYAVPTTTWTEIGITWNNKPALGSSLASVTVSGTSYVWYEFDVTSYVQSEQAAGRNVVSFALHATATSNRVMSIKSRESASQKPELVVTGNAPPSASVTSPANGAVFPQPANITINATATDPDGTIAKVEFFQGTTKIGEDTTAPYSFAWNDVLAAAYSLTARATDNGGAMGTSSAVGVTVTEGGPTLVSGGISANTTWTLAASPYVVTGEIAVASSPAPVLTIEPGVVVKFNSGTTLKVGSQYLGTTYHGVLQAIGTANRPITFTANTGSPTAGYWQGIQFYKSGASASQVSFATVRYGGVTGSSGGLRAIDSSPTFDNVTVRDSAHSGVSFEGTSSPSIANATVTANPIGLHLSLPATSSLQNVTISSNTGYAISMDGAGTLGTVSGLTISGNGSDAILLRNPGINVDTTWRNLGVPYVVLADVAIGRAAAPPPILTIEPGVTVKFGSGTALKVGFTYLGPTYPGQLQAIGTTQQPITFTANTASPMPGYWQGVEFFASGASASRISNATVRYGGTGSGGGIRVIDSSPTIENVTVRDSLHSGITCQGPSTPAVTGTTITANPIGLYLYYPTAPTLQNVTISSNSGYAISQDARVTLGAVSGITVTGNGKDAIEVRANGIDLNTTWKNLGIPYVCGELVIGKPTQPYPVLTIEPGVTVKFNPGGILKAGFFYLTQPYPGILQAVGTAALPITFTANTATPVPGYWQGVQFYDPGASPSRISYATVSYGGFPGNYGGIHLSSNASPVFDHVGFQSNSYAGISATGSSPIIRNCDFTANTAGLINLTPATLIDARFNWWNAVTGPSGAGTGTGQSISTGTKFEPWLASAGSAPQYFDSFALGNSTFNPTLEIYATFTFASSLSGNWAVKVFNSGDVLLRTLTGSGATATVAWDGKDQGGSPQPNGTYKYQVESTTGASESAAPLRGFTSLDSTRQLAINSPAIAPPFFSPNADAIQETTVVTGASTFDGATWTVNVKNSGGATVRSATGPANPAISYAWDGRDGGGTLQPDGGYTLELLLVDGTASASANFSVTLDVTFPSAAVTYPAGSETLSNVYQSGQANVLVTGTSADTNLNNWTLDYGPGPSPPPGMWTIVTTGTSPVVASTLATWSTEAVINGLYTLRLRVWDKAGNLSTQTRNPTVGNFTVSQSALSFNSGTGGTVTYTSAVPFPLTETLVVKSEGGQVVRTLFTGQRAAGTFVDAWNGRDAQGALLPEGPYFYTASASDGTHSMNWDLTNQYVNSSFYYYSSAQAIPNFEPFNNRLLALQSLSPGSGPGRTWILFTPTYSSEIHGEVATAAMCGNPGNYCQPAGEYQAPGQVNPPWAGIDPSGNFRKDIVAIVTIVNRTTFSRNAVVSHGTKPTITNLVVAPTYYAPMAGQQSVSFSLTTYQSQPVTVRLTATNLDSHSVLRTKTVNGVAAGAGSISWDGRADNGTWVAAGRYILDLLVTDAIGNTAKAQTLTVVDY